MDSLNIIKDLPTNEVYDLMFDSKGLLWIGHDLGLSSYDGKVFKNYSNSLQSSKAVTGMLEDKQGRIWCYNFSGQIFWVKNGVMHLLEEYNANKELVFPRIAICNNELLASSDRGFFVYNLETNKAKYFSTGGPIRSLVVVGDYAYAATATDICSYTANGGVSKVPLETVIPNGKDLRLMFQAQPQADTIFTITNPSSRCHRFIVNGRSIRLLDVLQVGNFINDVTCNGTETWLHTKTKSILLGTSKEITGYNLTDIVTDREGNKWFSSLKYGVMMSPYYNLDKKYLSIPFQRGDYIRTVVTNARKFFFGTQAGDVFVQDIGSGKIKKIFSNNKVGAIEFLSVYDSVHIAICPTMGFYLLNVQNNQVIKILPAVLQIKDVHVTKMYTMLSSTSIFLTPNYFNKPDTGWVLRTLKKYSAFVRWKDLDNTTSHNVFEYLRKDVLFWEFDRCRSAVFVAFNDAVLASFVNGVVVMEANKKPRPLLYNNKRVKATKLFAYQDKIFISSVIGSVLVYDKNGVHALQDDQRPQPENILKIFLVDHQLYILTQDGICIVDAASEKTVGYCELSGATPGNVLDIKRVNGNTLLVMNEGVYSLSGIDTTLQAHPVISLSYATVNGRDTLLAQNNILSHNQSDLRFYLSAPWYTNTDVVYMAYRLLGSNDTSWQYLSRTDQPVYYASLSPGKYQFEAKAIHRLSNFESEVVLFSFEIHKAWWQTFFFRIIALLAIGNIVAYFVRRYYIRRLLRQKRFYEKELAVEKERERISADIHDELGGTLSGIKLMTEMTERKYLKQVNVKHELHDIHASVTSLSQKMREVIWSLSNENNALDNLLDYLLRRGREMFVNSDIVFHAELPENIPVVQLKGDKRRHIYLATKEALHNALKHADASKVYMLFIVAKTMLYIEIRDDGKGFGEHSIQHTNGLKNMKFRMQQIGGDILLSENDGVVIIFSIPIP